MTKSHFRKVEELDPEAQQLVQQVSERLRSSLAKTRQRYRNDGTDFSLLGSPAAKRAATASLETLQQMMACISLDERCDLSWMQVMFEEELQNFRIYARRDLGIDA